LYKAAIPVLEYKFKKKNKKFEFDYRWIKTNDNFKMPIRVMINNRLLEIVPNVTWQTKVFDEKYKSFDMPLSAYLIFGREIK